jgi:UDPglucose 6-dehydrogenase
MIGFAGLSHLGIVSSLAAAGKGQQVVAFDPDFLLTRRLTAGDFPIVEPGLADLYQSCRSRIRFSSDIRDFQNCDLVVFSCDVPTDETNRSDLAPISELIDTVFGHLPESTVAVVLSQVPPGFTRKLLSKRKHSIFYQVETLIFGSAVERALHPERFIVGCRSSDEELPQIYADYLRSFDCPILRMRYESAELAKIAINMFLISSVSTTNTLAELCEALAADWSEIEPALRLDKRIGPHAYVTPGLGLGGGNLERDLATVRSLASECGSDSAVPDAFLRNSGYRAAWVLRMVHREVFTKIAKPTLCVFGLAYKSGTHSTKNSPSVDLLHALPRIRIRVYDPKATLETIPENVSVADSAVAACANADALVVMTPWPEFKSLDLQIVARSMSHRILIDPFAVFSTKDAQAGSFAHFRLGCPSRAGEETSK